MRAFFYCAKIQLNRNFLQQNTFSFNQNQTRDWLVLKKIIKSKLLIKKLQEYYSKME